MKTNAEILMLIMKKINEHTNEVVGATNDLEGMRLNLKNSKSSVALEGASKILILKDKVMFHKACIAALNDLKLEIEK